MPRETREAVHEHDPAELNQQTLRERRARDLAHVYADGEIKLIRERREEERAGDPGRQNVQRKEMAAGDVFEGVQDEDEGGDFEHPEREHGHRVGEEKLQERRQHQGREEAAERGPVASDASRGSGRD